MPYDGCVGWGAEGSIGSLWFREEELHDAEVVDPSAEYQILLLNVGSCASLHCKFTILFVCSFKRVNLLHWR